MNEFEWYISEPKAPSLSESTVKDAVERIYRFKNHKVDIFVEDVLNILIDTNCISKDELKSIIDKVKASNSFPVAPTNHLF
jgi:hypothetical protein